MLQQGTAKCFHSADQSAGSFERVRDMSFKDAMLLTYAKSKKTCDEALGVGLQL